MIYVSLIMSLKRKEREKTAGLNLRVHFRLCWDWQPISDFWHPETSEYIFHISNQIETAFMGGLISDLKIAVQSALYIIWNLTHNSDVTSREPLALLAGCDCCKKHISTTSVTNVVWCDGGLLRWDKILLWCEEWEDTSPLFTQPAACCFVSALEKYTTSLPMYSRLCRFHSNWRRWVIVNGYI